jgi:hypothetical protein
LDIQVYDGTTLEYLGPLIGSLGSRSLKGAIIANNKLVVSCTTKIGELTTLIFNFDDGTNTSIVTDSVSYNSSVVIA